jgi:hypothetical protein
MKKFADKPLSLFLTLLLGAVLESIFPSHIGLICPEMMLTLLE